MELLKIEKCVANLSMKVQRLVPVQSTDRAFDTKIEIIFFLKIIDLIFTLSPPLHLPVS